MSAASQNRVPFARSLRPITEIELLRVVSRLTWNAKSQEECFASLAEALLRLPGFAGFRFEPARNLSPLSTFKIGFGIDRLEAVCARASVSANGRIWGELRLCFHTNTTSTVESPVSLARLMGQQIALLLHRLALKSERALLLLKIEKIQQAIRHRKLIYGAAKILAQQRSLSERDAISEIIRYARRNRRTLLNVSESLILGHDIGTVTRPFFRRLASHERTTKPACSSEAQRAQALPPTGSGTSRKPAASASVLRVFP